MTTRITAISAVSRAPRTEDVDSLRAIGLQWAAARPTSCERDCPSRSAAHAIASEVLGRPATAGEALIVQRAARDACHFLDEQKRQDTTIIQDSAE
jgi:hypothetical protein